MAKCDRCGEKTFNTHIEVSVKECRNGLDGVNYDTLVFCKDCQRNVRLFLNKFISSSK